MNILFLAHRIPYPPDKGDKIRSFNEIKYLSENNNIYLGTILDVESDQEYLVELKRYCKEVYSVYFYKKLRIIKSVIQDVPFSVSYFYNFDLQEYVNEILENENIDIVICFCSTMAEYIFRSRPYKEKELNNISLIMDYVDLDSDKWLQYSRYTRFPYNLLYKLENKWLLKYEININRTFNQSVFVSQREVDVFRKLYPEVKNVHFILNGVDSDYFTPEKSTQNSQNILVFTGVMDYFANEDGVKWFCENIFHKIKAEIPDVLFYIVGNRPTKRVLKLSKIKGVFVTGYVPDIRKYYLMANVCVIPLRIARGLQNKILEAMATGNAVVATTNASDGLIYNKKVDIIIADEEEAFAREVITLLKDEKRRKEIGIKAIENIQQNYSWQVNLKAFDNLLKNKFDTDVH